MKPVVAMPVVINGFESNGTTEHPGVVNRVWGEGDPAENGQSVRINATLFPDHHPAMPLGSISFLEDREAALEYQQRTGEPYVAWFPEF